ncbi:hypothetical protein DSO57_1010761 [Entomophthora muscae]|uniref:Uncharacterized protein n=1 Tax=Entomophthora muscae TaxID=34485 RepID=A0ACC2UG52_9FUNG|nr:hypothetical protein DSO57_1010761 [Entomophthora muscae]
MISYLASVAIAAILVSCVYTKFQPKANIAHVPAVPIYRTILAMLLKLPFDDVLAFTGQLDLLHKFKMIRAYFQGEWTVMVACPKMAQAIYTDTESFPKLVPTHQNKDLVFSKLTGHSAFFSSNEEWRTQRKTLLDPAAFISYISHKSTLTALDQTMQNMCTRLQTQTTHDCLDIMQRITFDCLTKQFLNQDFNQTTQTKSNPIISLFDNAFDYSHTLLTFLLPSLQNPKNPFYRKVYEDINNWEACLKSIVIGARKTLEIEGISGEPDLVTKMVISAKANNFSDDAITDNLKMLFLPSQSLPPALCAAFHFLAQESQVQEKVYAEISSVVGPSKEGFSLTGEQLKSLPYLSAVIKETLRLYPTLCPPPKRVAAKDVVIEGHTIPKGTSVMIDMFAIQRDPSLFENPTEFNPTRFLGSKFNGSLKSSEDSLLAGFLPFAAGTRRCPASQLVDHLMLNILANAIYKFKVVYPVNSASAPSSLPHLKFKLKLQPKVIFIPDNLQLSFEKRL